MMSLGGALILAGLLSFFGSPGEKAELSELAVDLSQGRLEVSFRLADAFDQELLERIDAGLPSGFTYQFKLVRPSKLWFDNTVESSRLEVLATYNAVTREYQINYKQDGKLTESRVLTDPAELESALTRVDGFTPFTLENVSTRKPVHLRVRATLGSKNLLLLIPTTVHTDWIASDRFLVPGRATSEG